MPSENYISRLFARSLSGEASAAEIVELHELLTGDELLQQRYDILKQFWNSHNNSSQQTEEDKKISLLLQKANCSDSLILERKRKRLRIKAAKRFFAAGTVIALISVSAYFLLNDKTNSNTVTEKKQPLQLLVAQKGSRSKTILPDGSVVWLNAGSYLSYPGNFTGNKREVYLTGEAFFDVVKQPTRPFIVHANGIDIKVLGTSFDVKSYPEEKKIEATLIRGLIQITEQGKKDQKPVYLHPNEKLIIDLDRNNSTQKKPIQNVLNDSSSLTLFHLDSTIKTENRVETAWVYNRLEFKGESFEELAKKLERWYNIQIIFSDEASRHLSFYGSFENETVQQAFAALQAAVPFEYNFHEGQVTIKSVANE